jgi:hypothetical protein
MALTTSSILYNTPGSGKTRLLFEGLCRYWGFYFVAAQGTDCLGAHDLKFMTDIMPESPGWTRDIFQDTAVDKVCAANQANEEIALRRTSQVLLARWIIFETFITVARSLNDGALPESIKHDWLLFQILPMALIGDLDPFLALSRLLIGTSPSLVRQLQTPLSPRTVLRSAFNSNTESFHYILDEAQISGHQYMGSFSDGHGKQKRPVLRPILRFLTDFSVNDSVTVSGTRFSLDMFSHLRIFSVGKVSEWNVVYETGDFQNQEVQEAYLSRYLSPSFLASTSCAALVIRMYGWLRGQ